MPKPKKLDPLLLPAWEHLELLAEKVKKVPESSREPYEELILTMLRQLQGDLERGEVELVIEYFQNILDDMPNPSKEESEFAKARHELFRTEYSSILETLRAYHERRDLGRPLH